MLERLNADFNLLVQLFISWTRKPGLGTIWREVRQTCLASGIDLDAVCYTCLVGERKIIQRSLGRKMCFRFCFGGWRGKRMPVMKIQPH